MVDSNLSFGDCGCDLTKAACDPYCCCDADCSKGTVYEWKLAKACADVSYDMQIMDFLSECEDVNTAPTIKDLQNGLYVYEKNLKKIFCPKKISITKKLGGFLDVNLATDKDSYNKLLDNET